MDNLINKQNCPQAQERGGYTMTDSFLVSVDKQYMTALSITPLIMNIKKLGLNPDELFLYLFVSHLQSQEEEIPSQSVLADLMGFSERKLKYIIADLKDKELLTINRRKGMEYNFEGLKRKIQKELSA